MPGGDTQRSYRFLFPPDIKTAAGRFKLDDLPLVNPDLDPPRGNPQPDAVPPVLLKWFVGGRLVLVSGHCIDIGEPHQFAPPTAQDQRTVFFANRERETTKEIAAVGPHRFQGKLVIVPRRLASPHDSGRRAARLQFDPAVADADISMIGKAKLVCDVPAGQRLAVKQVLRRTRLGTSRVRWTCLPVARPAAPDRDPAGTTAAATPFAPDRIRPVRDQHGGQQSNR